MTEFEARSKPLTQWTDEERIRRVKNIFNRITPHYDLMNHLLSAGRDIAWRRFAVKRIHQNAEKVLDVATGTGDLAIETARLRSGVEVYGVDFALKMVEAARVKTDKRGLSNRIFYTAGDAMALPFGDDSFDASAAAFGLRNMPDKLKILEEMSRVVKPGGKVLILEMTFSENVKLRWFFKWYFKHIMPRLGGIVARNRGAYQYLPDSIQDFPGPDELSGLFERAGLGEIRAFPLNFDLTYLHEGVVV